MFPLDAFQNDRERPGFLNRRRVFEELIPIAPHLVSAERLDALRNEPAMPDDRNPGVDDRPNRRRSRRAAFDFNRRRLRFLQNPSATPNRFVRPELAKRKRNVDDDQRPLRRPRDRLRVIDHLVERRAQRRRPPLNDGRQRVADEKHIEPRRVRHSRRRIIVRGNDGDLFAAFFHLQNLQNGIRARFIRHFSSSFARFFSKRRSLGRSPTQLERRFVLFSLFYSIALVAPDDSASEIKFSIYFDVTRSKVICG